MGFVVGLSGLWQWWSCPRNLLNKWRLASWSQSPLAGAHRSVAALRARIQRCHRPYRTGGGETPVLDVPVCNDGLLATGAGDRRGSSEGFQSTSVVEFRASSPISANTRAPTTGPTPGNWSGFSRPGVGEKSR